VDLSRYIRNFATETFAAGDVIFSQGDEGTSMYIVVEGEVDVTTEDGADFANAKAGHLLEFAPGERRTIVARSDARLLMVLSPWPGDGHPGAMTLEEKAEAREKAAQHSQ